MSTVLWANLLVEGKVKTDESDKFALYKHAKRLDSISKKQGLGSFIEICDTTDVLCNMDVLELPEGMDSTNDLMAVQGTWMDISKAMQMLEGLLVYVQKHKVRFGIIKNDYDEVVAELSEALAYTKSVVMSPSTKFNFSIVT